jgi:hypothetical protein
MTWMEFFNDFFNTENDTEDNAENNTLSGSGNMIDKVES